MDFIEHVYYYSQFYEKFHQFQIKERMLPSGDFIYGNVLGVERKSATDFVSSIKKGHIFVQIHDLAVAFERAVVLCTFNITDIEREVDCKAVLTSLADFSARYNMHCRFCGTEKLGAYYVLQLAYKVRHQVTPKWVIRKPIPNSRDEKLLVLMGIAGIGEDRAANLLKEFKSLEGVFNATKTQLMKVPLIGKKSAEHIVEIWKNEDVIYDYELTIKEFDY